VIRAPGFPATIFFLCPNGNAFTFNNILEAEEFCRAQDLSGLQLIQQTGYFPHPLLRGHAKLEIGD
jgi:hypothetical protein